MWKVKDAEGNEKGTFRSLTQEEGATIRRGLPEGWTITHYLSMPDPEVGTRMDWIRFKLGTGPEPGSDEWKAQFTTETVEVSFGGFPDQDEWLDKVDEALIAKYGDTILERVYSMGGHEVTRTVMTVAVEIPRAE